MSSMNIVIFHLLVYFTIFQLSFIDCRPHTKTIVIHGHEWTVPDEPGWNEVLQEAEPIRHKLLSRCASSRECRMAAELLREVFLRHPVSAKYYDDSMKSGYRPNEAESIFKWG